MIYQESIIWSRDIRLFSEKRMDLPELSGIIDDFYVRLEKVAEQLTVELDRPVTIREALLRLLKTEKLELVDFAWSWRFEELTGAEKRIGGT